LAQDMGAEAGRRLAGVALRVVERLSLVLLVGLATVFFTLFALDLARGTPAGEALGRAGQGFVDYVVRLAHGDLGATSAGGATARRMPVAEVLAATLPRSLGLLGVTLAVSTLIGVAIGVLAAISRRKLVASLLLLSSILGASAPSFFLALLLQLLVLSVTRAVGHSVLPVGGFGWGAPLVLPTLVLAARPLAQIARITYIKTREALEQDFVRTAFGKGLGLGKVLFRHVARNIAIPVLTTAAVSLRFALGSLPIVEVYFGWSGAGFTLLRAISSQDDSLAVALLLAFALVFFAVQTLLEFSYPLIDPRLGRASLDIEEQRPSLRGALAAAGDGLRSLLRQARDWIRYVTRAIPQWRPAWPRLRVPRTRAEWSFRPHLRHANLSLAIGGLLCLVLLVVVFFGSRLAPHNPYLLAGVEKVDGKYMGPPFAPSSRFPLGTDALGRDLLSLILVGAQQTLLLAGVAVAARIAVGTLLGAMAGWWRGSLVDRAIVGVAQVVTPFPILLLAMLVILAVGIRQGTLPFAIGLCVVGWGEVAQFVRAEIIALKSRPFVESAQAVGAGSRRVLVAHLLPHLAPSLTALVAIEFSSVLMLLGELGFLGIFLGGGAYMEMEMFTAPVHYSDVPEWGALLATFRQAARARPWLGIYPSLAIFVSALGFHLLGQGIRREIERGRLFLRRVFNRTTLVAAAVVGGVLYLLSGNLGSAGIYRREAILFSHERAAASIEALTAPSLGGREIGTPGAAAAADWIAQEFKRVGLQAIGQNGTYLLEARGGVERLTEVPSLDLNDGGPSLRYEVDFAEYTDQFLCLGEAEGEVRFVSFGESPAWAELDVSRFKRVDLSRDVVLVLSSQDAEVLAGRRCAGVLVVASDQELIARRAILSPESRADWAFTGTGVSSTPIDRVSFWISEGTAERILAGSGYTLADLRQRVPEVDARDPLTFVLPCRASLRAVGTAEENVPVRHVMGWIPGLKGNPRDQMDNQVIAILAQYDTAPSRPGAPVSQGANDNASGVAVLLELARLLTQTEYSPNRSFLLVAYSGTGWEGGELRAEPGADWFLERSSLPARFFTLQAVVRLRGLGLGASSRLTVETSGGMRLSNLFRSAASRMGARMDITETPVDLRAVFGGKTAFESGETTPQAILSYDRWREATGAGDPAVDIDGRDLERAGRAAALGIMTLGRELRY
jgi:peptide/nickel transport system permease protein